MSTLSLTEAADRCHIHENTMMRLIATGAIPAAKIGRAWVMLAVDVDHYIEQQIIRQTAERMGTPLQKQRRHGGRVVRIR